MLDGFLVVHRDILDSPMFADADLFRFWFYLRARANYQPGCWRDQPLAIGDLIVSQRRLAEAMHVSVGTIGRWLAKLEKFGEIRVKAGRDFSVVSVVRTDVSERDKSGERGASRYTDEYTGGARVDTPIDTPIDTSLIKQPSNQATKETPLPPRPADPKPAAPCLPMSIRTPAMIEAVESWLAYKAERREGYKPAGLKALYGRIATVAGMHGQATVIELMERAKASGWKGWDHKPPPSGGLFGDDPRGNLAALNEYLDTPQEQTA